MPAFHYQAYTTAGQTVAGTVEAPSEPEAIQILNARGLLPFKTEIERKSRTPNRGGLRKLLTKRMQLADYARVARELSVLLNSGIPLDHALRLLVDQAASSQLSDFANGLLESVTAGASLSEAIAQKASDAPAYITSLIRAGETRGNLGPALTDLADFLYKRAENRARIQSALTYPLVLSVTALGAVTLIIAFLVPAIMPLFEDSGVEPPRALLLALHIGEYASERWLTLAIATLLTVVAFTRLMRRERIQLAVDRMILRLPITGAMVSKANTALLAKTLGTLLRNGVALVPALRLTASVVPNRPFSMALVSAAERVREGHRLAAAVSHSPDLPQLLSRFIAIGEEASKLDEMMLHLADISQNDAERHFNRFMTLLPPLLTIVIGVLVGALILSVMQAILSVNQLVVR